VQNYLSREGIPGLQRFDDLFRDFVIANLLNDRSIADGRYGHQNVTGKATIAPQYTLQFRDTPATSVTGSVRPYATRYVDLQPGGRQGTLALRFSGSGEGRLYDGAPHSGRAQWWGNAADEMESTLTHAFDLTGVDHATLTFSLWYDTERDYDYAGVAVSTDGGCTWQTLTGQHTTATDPLGQNVTGNGYTGHSGGGEVPVWVDESMDLSAYAGQKVLVRFFNITDQSYHGSGIAIDDVSIPEIGFADDAETDQGWQNNGFLRSVNAATLDWAVQAVVFSDSGVQVLQVPLTRTAAAGADTTTVSGTLTVPQFGASVSRVVVAASPLLPVTLVPVDFSLDATVR
jgi:hypothetical protein